MKFLLIEDHELYIDGLVEVIMSNYTDTIVNTATNFKDVLNSLNKNIYDIVFLDINLGGVDTLKRIREIKMLSKTARIIVLSSYFTQDLLKYARDHDLSGYLKKNSSKAEVLHAIDYVSAGGDFIASDYKGRLNFENYDSYSISSSLSLRERDIISLLAQGNSNSGVAEKLFISPNTVRTHRKNIYKKLEINSIQELVSLAYKLNIVK